MGWISKHVQPPVYYLYYLNIIKYAFFSNFIPKKKISLSLIFAWIDFFSRSWQIKRKHIFQHQYIANGNWFVKFLNLFWNCNRNELSPSRTCHKFRSMSGYAVELTLLQVCHKKRYICSDQHYAVHIYGSIRVHLRISEMHKFRNDQDLVD